jgi:Mg-chelatase subunit ChlD
VALEVRGIGRIIGTVCLAGLLAPMAAASTGRLEIRAIDLAAYPTIRVTVVVPLKTQTPPTLTESGALPAALRAVNVGDKESISLVLDHSQSMHGAALADGIRAAEAFVAAKPSSDEISVVGAASEPLILAAFSTATSLADDALNSLSVDRHYGTVLWDSLVLTANQLRVHGLPGRAIILVTDGQETTSKATLTEAIAAVRLAHASVYTVGIPDRSFTPAPLRKLARATGGRYYRAPSPAALANIYRAIAAELDRTWQLQFLTAARPGETLRLTAKAEGELARADTVLPRRFGIAATDGSTRLLLILLLIVVSALAIIVLPLARPLMHPSRWRRRSASF